MTPLIALLLQNIPGIIAFAREQFGKAHPGEPVPTEAEIKAAYLSALAASLSKDADWLSAHPQA